MRLTILLPGVGSTSQILFRADWSSAKTPEAPNNKVITPIIEAKPPVAGSLLCSITT